MIERRLDELAARAELASDYAASRVEGLARQGFLMLWERLQAEPGADVRALVLEVAQSFGSAYTVALAAAFERLLQQAVMPSTIAAMPVGEVQLSAALYRQAQTAAAEVSAIVRTHAQGVHQARALLLELFDGYSPAQGLRRPLEGRARARLPAALRFITQEPVARASLARVYERAQKQAARLRSPALRASYLEALEAWRTGAGRDALRKRLEVAHKEKARHFAERIAQTELAKAYQARVAAELMEDPSTQTVQVTLNPAHPRADVCDLHGRADLFGLGAGVYPKAQAPRPPFHPFCWCRLRARQDIEPGQGRPVEGAARVYLRSLGPEGAARVMGSAERAQRVLNGESPAAVLAEGVSPAHRTRLVGDPEAARHHVLESPAHV